MTDWEGGCEVSGKGGNQGPIEAGGRGMRISFETVVMTVESFV